MASNESHQLHRFSSVWNGSPLYPAATHCEKVGLNRNTKVVVLFLLLAAAMPLRAEYRWGVFVEAFNTPYRKIGDQVVDLTPLFAWHRSKTHYERPLRDWKFIAGYIASVPTNGVLVRVDASMREAPDLDMVWVRNYPLQRHCVDGDRIAVLARETGRHQYRSAIGALMTVPLYDWGLRLTPEEEQIADSLRRVNVDKVLSTYDKAIEQRARQKAAADVKAVAHQQQRAAAGSAQAQYDLAVRYLTGAGVDQNIEEARRFLNLSAAQDFGLARQKLIWLQTNSPPGATNFVGAIK